MGSLSLTMFLVLSLCLLVSLSSPLPHQRTLQEESGLILDKLAGLGGDTTTTVAPVDTTTFPTLYGDLVNIFNLIFKPATTTITTAQLQLPTTIFTTEQIQLPTTTITTAQLQLPTTTITTEQLQLPTKQLLQHNYSFLQQQLLQ